MTFYHRKSDTLIGEGNPFELDGVSYPSNWLNLSSAEDKEAHGLVEVKYQDRPEYDSDKQEVYAGPFDKETATNTWLIRDLSESELEGKAKQTREIAKSKRAAAVAAIVVTTSTGKSFDGDEASQTRMARAILGLKASGVPTIRWTLSDNSITEATLDELTEAMILAGQAQSELWAI